MNKTETTCDVCAKSKPRSNRWCKECIALHCLANSLWRVRYDESDLLRTRKSRMASSAMRYYQRLKYEIFVYESRREDSIGRKRDLPKSSDS